MAETNKCPVMRTSITWLEAITNYMKDKGIIPKGSIIDVGLKPFYRVAVDDRAELDDYDYIGDDYPSYTAYLEYISSQGFQAFRWSNHNAVEMMKAYELLYSLQKMEVGEITYFSLRIFMGRDEIC